MISDIFGVSGRAMLAALIAGQANPHELARLARGSMRAKTSVLQEALTGHFTGHHAFMLGMMLARIDALAARSIPSPPGSARRSPRTPTRSPSSMRSPASASPPPRGLTAGGVTQAVAAAARRAGLGTIYAHRLRHTAATAILAEGGSLAEIGQVLRHRRPLTTAAYTKVNVEALRALARPWPGAS